MAKQQDDDQPPPLPSERESLRDYLDAFGQLMSDVLEEVRELRRELNELKGD